MTVKLINERSGVESEFEDKDAAQDERQKLIELGVAPEDVQLKTEETKADGGSERVDVVDDESPEPQPTPAQTDTDTIEPDVINNPEQLAKDPIGWLENINNAFVNRIKGTPAISKQGFRFIQSQFGITTESEVVETFDEPTGVIVWARAELPDGQAAEAHGEGYLTESRVDDNEFVRYADTRAKNRAISDLTSAGALAVSELSEE